MESNEVDDVKLYALIGERIKQRRIERGNTQAWLADRVGLLRTSISNIEMGRQRAPLHVIYALCDVLEVDPFDILPPLIEVQRLGHEEVVIDQNRVARVPPKAADFLRGAMDNSTRSTT